MRHPVDTAEGKIAPILQTINELVHNSDRYGNQVYDPNDKVASGLKHIVTAAEPFAVRNFQQQAQSGAPPSSLIQSVLGVTPASAAWTRSPALSKAAEYAGSSSAKVHTLDQQQAMTDKRQMVQGALQQGGTGELSKRLDQEVSAGRMTGKQAADTLKPRRPAAVGAVRFQPRLFTGARVRRV